MGPPSRGLQQVTWHLIPSHDLLVCVNNHLAMYVGISLLNIKALRRHIVDPTGAGDRSKVSYGTRSLYQFR